MRVLMWWKVMAEKGLPRRRSWNVSPAQWLIAISLSAIAVCLLVEVSLNATEAGPQLLGDDTSSILAVAGQVTKDSYGLYMIDTKNGTICVYQWLPNIRKLRLLAARNFTFDLRLDEYNTEPSPKEIKKLVEQARRLPAASTKP